MVCLLLIIVIIAYKKWKRKPEIQNNKKIDAKGEKASSSIPEPTKKQDLVRNKKSDLKNEEKEWKRPVGVKISKDTRESSISDSKMKIHDQNKYMKKAKTPLHNLMLTKP